MSSFLVGRIRYSAIPKVAAAGLGLAILSRTIGSTAEADSPAPKKVFGSRGPSFVSLPLASVEVLNEHTKKLRFELPSEDSVSGLPLTSSLLTLSWPKGKWLPVARPYTPVSHSDQKGFLDLVVKRYENGKQSTHLHSLQPGDTLMIAAVLKGYNWIPNQSPHVVLIAGGTGITPIYQLAQGILRNPDDKTSITMVIGGDTINYIPLRAEIQQLHEQYGDRLRTVYAVKRQTAGSTHYQGHIDVPLLSNVAPSSKNSQSMVYVCGPPAMENTIIGTGEKPGILGQLGYRKDQIHKF